MSRPEKVSIDIPREVADIIDEAVTSGEFGSASEMVSSALVEWKTSRLIHGFTLAELDALVQEGIDSGEPIDGETALREIREEFLREFGDRL